MALRELRAPRQRAERALHVDARKILYKKLHPETKGGVAGGKASGRKRSNKSQNETCSDEPADAFIADTAAKTGKGSSTVACDAKRGKEGIRHVADVGSRSAGLSSVFEPLIHG
jgi:hypothetical protein